MIWAGLFRYVLYFIVSKGKMVKKEQPKVRRPEDFEHCLGTCMCMKCALLVKQKLAIKQGAREHESLSATDVCSFSWDTAMGKQEVRNSLLNAARCRQ